MGLPAELAQAAGAAEPRGHPKFVAEPARQIPVYAEVDVAVCGGGPAGVCAAIAAARTGAKTLLIERHGFFGGMLTAGWLGTIAKFNDRSQTQPDYPNPNLIIRGIPLELIRRLQAAGALVGQPERDLWLRYDVEAMKRAAAQMLQEAGVKLLLHTWVAQAILDGAILRGVFLENKSGRQAVLAKVVVDCTGDGDVAARAGAPYELGDDLQPMTLQFRAGGVEVADYPARITIKSSPKLYPLIEKAYREGKYAIPQRTPWMSSLPRHDQVIVNGTRLMGSAVDADALTRAEVEGRKQEEFLIDFLRQHYPPFHDAYLIDTGTQVGTRETRRIMGEYLLTAEDVLAFRTFDDAIARCAYPIDVHSHRGHGVKMVFFPSGKSYTVPYRCLVPQRIENLLVSGRCVSATREALGSLRVTSQCMALGHAAGTAAALPVQHRTTPRRLDVALLQAMLRKQDARF